VRGFGPLQGGLWIAPSSVDHLDVLGADLEGGAHLKVFTATAVPPTDVDALVRDAWDLDALAARYRGFLQRWEQASRRPRLPDCLASQLVLQTEWLQVIRRDPRLPVQHLPQDWPAAQAQQLFRGLYAEFEPRARAAAADLDVVPDEDVGRR
jgi:phenylacetic acid degradation operon negative regulatory protein